MNRKFLNGIWFLTVLLLTLVAGFSWVDVLLSPASGGQAIQVTGYTTFPIISALVLLQGASLLAAIFTPAVVAKAIAALQLPIIAWHLFVVITSAEEAAQLAVAGEITKATGVEGVASQAQLVELALDNNLWYIYAGLLAVNLAVLVALVFAKTPTFRAKVESSQVQDPGELWESQS